MSLAMLLNKYPVWMTCPVFPLNRKGGFTTWYPVYPSSLNSRRCRMLRTEISSIYANIFNSLSKKFLSQKFPQLNSISLSAPIRSFWNFPCHPIPDFTPPKINVTRTPPCTQQEIDFRHLLTVPSVQKNWHRGKHELSSAQFRVRLVLPLRKLESLVNSHPEIQQRPLFVPR